MKMFRQFYKGKKEGLLGKSIWAARYCIQYNILTEIASAKQFQGGIVYQIFHPLLTTCMIPIVMMFMLNCAIIKRFRNSSTNTRNKMRYLFLNNFLAKNGFLHFTTFVIILTVYPLNNRREIRMSVIMMIIFVVFVLTNMPRTVLGLYEVTTISSILECYDRACQYHVSSLRSVNIVKMASCF